MATFQSLLKLGLLTHDQIERQGDMWKIVHKYTLIRTSINLTLGDNSLSNRHKISKKKKKMCKEHLEAEQH